MRLNCPNCGAQYEVADDVIPQDGRDVQCSNCAHTWFEQPAGSGIESAFADLPSQRKAAEPAKRPKPAVESTEAPAPARDRQELDPAIADILREEAAREAEARRKEDQTAFQSQPDLGIDAAIQPKRERPVRQPAPEPASLSKQLLPDIEEINSSLRPGSDRIELDDSSSKTNAKKKPSGFRRGFLFVILILLLLVCVYVFAPQISELVPQTAQILENYVNAVNDMRLKLDAWSLQVLEGLDATS